MSEQPQGPDWWLGADGKWYPPVAPSPNPAPERSKSPALMVLGVVLVVAVVAGGFLVARQATSDTTSTLRGTFVLEPERSLSGVPIEGAWSRCRGTGGYSDFGPGMTVTVRDESSTIIASTQTRSVDDSTLEALVEMDRSSSWTGTLISFEDDPTTELRRWLEHVPSTMERCVVYFETEIPARDFYEISIGRRGELSYSYDELVDRDFTVALTLGR